MDFLQNNTQSLQGFMPITDHDIIYDLFKGYPLPNGKGYRRSNLEKANKVLASSLKSQNNLFSFQFDDELHENFDKHLRYFDKKARYLKSDLEFCSNTLLIFTRKTENEVIAFLNKRYDAFCLKHSISDIASSPASFLEATKIAYELAQDYALPKRSQKSKQLTGSMLKPEDKTMSIEFELKPTLVLRC